MLDIEQFELFLHTRKKGFISQVRQVKTSVLVPIVFMDDGQLGVLFEERAHTLRRQPGEISFPGGHAEPDDLDERDTAIRETSEELGVSTEKIQYIGPLDVLVAWSGLVVSPFVGVIPPLHELNPNPGEVHSLFTVGLNTLLDSTPRVHDVLLRPEPPEDFPYHLIPNGRDYAWRTMKTTQVFYECEGRVIWGLTARILSHFLDTVREGGLNQAVLTDRALNQGD